MDTTISILTELFERAKYSREEYRVLLNNYATVLATMLKQFHDYKAKHVSDIAAWHRSYRSQLAEARAENSRLREQIWEMQQHAGQANENLREFRSRYDENESRWERRVDMRAIRQELRFWKRMAMPDMPEDDPYWSDDDDLVDGLEKLRLRDLEEKAAQQQLAGAGGGLGPGEQIVVQVEEQDGSQVVTQTQPMVGGVPMQREDSIVHPVLPPRPSSANSTGSSGQ